MIIRALEETTGLRRLYIVSASQIQDDRAHDPGISRNCTDCQCNNEIRYIRSQCGNDAHRQKYVWNADQYIHNTHDDIIDLAAKIASRRAKDAGHQHGAKRYDHADDQRYTGTVNDAGEYIAAKAVRTEWMSSARRLIAVDYMVSNDRTVIDDNIRKNRHQCYDNQYDEGDHCRLLRRNRRRISALSD